MQNIKRIIKSILKVVQLLTVILIGGFILDLISSIAPWVAPTLSVISIIVLIVLYYFKGKED